jgi:hypothetical protein
LIATESGRSLHEAVVSAGWGDWSQDVPNNETLHIWFWNEHEGYKYGAEFLSGRCEYPEVYADLCQLSPTATPTPELPEYLPEAGAEAAQSASDLSSLAWLGWALIASGGILRRSARRR